MMELCAYRYLNVIFFASIRPKHLLCLIKTRKTNHTNSLNQYAENQNNICFTVSGCL